MKICPKCNALVEDASSFCPLCGASVDSSVPPVAQPPESFDHTVSVRKSTVTPTADSYQTAAFTPPNLPQINPTAPKKKSKTPIIIFSVISIILIVSLVLGMVFLEDIRDYLDDLRDDTPTQTTQEENQDTGDESQVSSLPSSAPTVSDPTPLVMPNFVGFHVSVAENWFGTSDCILIYQYEYNNSVSEGYIISQSVPQGTSLAPPK